MRVAQSFPCSVSAAWMWQPPHTKGLLPAAHLCVDQWETSFCLCVNEHNHLWDDLTTPSSEKIALHCGVFVSEDQRLSKVVL